MISDSTYTPVLKKVEKLVKELGMEVNYLPSLDPFFKGDLDGKTIYIGDALDDEEKLFNLLHLVGHTVQWCINEEYYQLGSVLHKNPDEKLLKKLQDYEWQANCYGLGLLFNVSAFELEEWFHEEYIIDMIFLTHYYITGKKLKINVDFEKIKEEYDFPKKLKPLTIPVDFMPKAFPRSRNGIVINFES